MKGLPSVQDETRELQRKGPPYLFLITILLLALLLRSWYLQVIQGEHFSELSENNRMRVVVLKPPRGLIFDRNGNLLANNVPSFNLNLVLEDIQDPEVIGKRLNQLIGFNEEEFKEKALKPSGHLPYMPVTLRKGLSLREVSIIEGHQLDLPGVEIHVEPRRHYLYGSLAAHLLGYVSEVSASQLEEGYFKGLLPGTVVGQYGVEKTFDSLIRGKRGKKVIEVNALGHEQQVVRVSTPHSGRDIFLTLDLELQQKAEKILGGRSGAIVAMDPKNGEILSLVSHPPFDPNLLSIGLRQEVWEIISTDPQRPLNNRVIQGQYPPGSVFKIVISSAVLESRKMDPDFQVDCKGYLPFGGRIFRDWKRGGHGTMGLHQAIVQSCDVFFYEVGYQLGVDEIAKYAWHFGLGEPTGIELESEKGGLIPTVDWKKRTRREPWYPGETLSVAIGQGFVSVTPLQLVNMISSVANGGTLFQPKVLKGVLEKQTRQLEEPLPMPSRRVEFNPETFAILREALRGVLSDPKGTARASRSDVVEIAGKTGTAQVIGIRPRAPSEPIPKEFLDHAWFVAFAPASDPQIAVVVLVENSGHGGAVAAPIAKEIIETYLAYDRSTFNHQL